MRPNRRDFIKKATLGSAALSSGLNFSFLSDRNSKISPQNAAQQKATQEKTSWTTSFDESPSLLSLANGPCSIKGQLLFSESNNKWGISKSRDGVPGRYALIDPRDNVQGYFVFNINHNQLQILFYHRTAQSFRGTFSFKGEINFLADSFACRTRPDPDERVLALSCGAADSLLNDSLFSPENDTALLLNASEIKINTLKPGSFSLDMSGKINESSQSVFSFDLERDYFKNRYVPYYHPIDRKRCPKTPTGWMSWNVYFDTATADDNLAEAKVGQKYLQPFGCEIWSIESWQGNSDKLPVRDFYNMNLETSDHKFPKGMKKLAEDIRKLGFRPGIWMAPFGTGNQEFYEAHKDWFLHGKDGKPLSCWNGRYTLDPTVPEAREHLKNIFRIASREWGYEYFKVDGMSGRSQGYCAHLYERPEIRAQFKDPSCPNPFELCVKAFREGMGEDRVFLACQGHTSGPEPLYADASRIGADIVSPNKPVEWTGVLHQGSCFMNQAFTHNIVMFADPDTLLVRDLPLEEARVSTTVIGLPGLFTFFGDKLNGLPEERMKMLQQTLPVADVKPVSLYPYFSMLPVWNLRVHNAMIGDYNVVALFNWQDKPQQISFTTKEIGIDSEQNYVLYEFWTQKDLGTAKNNFSMEVPAHAVRLIAMHPEKPVPQWISSDRHVSQSAMELTEYKWDNEKRAIQGKIKLIGTFPLTLRVRVPSDFSFRSIESPGVKYSTERETDNLLAITMQSQKTAEYPFRINF